MNSYKEEEQNRLYSKGKKSSSNRSLISLKKSSKVKTIHIIKDNKWNDGFNKNKLPEYESPINDNNNFKINLSIKSYSGKTFCQNKANLKSEKSLYIFSPKANKTLLEKSLNNGKILMKSGSARMRNIITDSDNLKYINMINLNNINKLWDDLCVKKSYRNLFYAIYKELNERDKKEVYQREITELISIKNEINELKSFIEQRLNIIEKISELNDKLNAEIINKNINQNKYILNEISNNIEVLRDYTINICFTMKKLKYKLNGIKNLDKYDINIISEKYDFDKNYLIKMKNELSFLKEGYAKYYFNIENDQTPFLLNASEKIEIKNDKESFIYTVPLKEETKYEIMECIFYIYQELIAYQNEKVNKNILRRISPLKKNEIYTNSRLLLTNGKEKQEINNINHKNKMIYNNNLILKKSSSIPNHLTINKNIKKNNSLNISNNFIYSKKKFSSINKNGNNLLIKQFNNQRDLNKDEKNKNILIGLKYKNNFENIQDNCYKKSEIIKKKNSIIDNINEKEKKLNFFSEDNAKQFQK